MPLHCTYCQAEIVAGLPTCNNCGYDIANAMDGKLICPACSSIYPDNIKFCTIDGAALVNYSQLIPTCLICKTTYMDGTRFCPKDGGRVAAALRQKPGTSNSYDYGEHATRRYPKASLSDRLVACIIDSVVTIALALPAIIVMAATRDLEFVGIALLALPFIYLAIKDGMNNGQSIGKKAYKLMVVNLDNNTPCDKGKSLLRNLISVLPGLIPAIGWLIEPVLAIVTVDGRKLGDRAANTQVVAISDYNAVNGL